MIYNFDVIVVGGGHAGCEAACAAARRGSTTLLITLDMNKIAQMSCNPAVGGIAKGQIVREIDALGGLMGIVTDQSTIQFRMLNRSKGPAMWSPRAQADRMKFMENWRRQLDRQPNLYVWQDDVVELLCSEGQGRAVEGVKTALGVCFHARAVVLTAGTFLGGMLHVGRYRHAGGRLSEPASVGLTAQLVALGHRADRMKTGTPPRLDSRTIDFNLTLEQPPETDFHHFSYLPEVRSCLRQRSCHIVYTNPRVHEILRNALAESPLYNGQITAIGPRYCPSIETKIVTFAERDGHQLFIEPEGETTCEMYLNGFSSSLPWQVQIEALHQIPALAHVQVYRPGYAIEYDFFDPTQLYHTLESKLVSGLFLAGQVNGTTGYEEAAGQGLVAGANAHAFAHNDTVLTLARDEAYIGVLIDDLVTKGVDEPYRMFTSRAEHRILLRQDDADLRLTPKADTCGLVDSRRLRLAEEKSAAVDDFCEMARTTAVRPDQVNGLLEQMSLTTIERTVHLRELLLRPQLDVATLLPVVPALREAADHLPVDRRDEILETAEVRLKYAGYIDRERDLADRLSRLDHLPLRGRLDYSTITQLSTEARQKLLRIDPATIGQAARIPGISPADINILQLLLRN